MAEKRANVNRALYVSALSDAIDWQDSFLAGHDPSLKSVTSCCKPGARCDGYKSAAALLARYKQAYTAITGRAH
jgi:hypothetical protein